MADTNRSPKIHARSFTSLLTFAAFLVMSFTGIALYVSPKGRVAHWTDWTLLGLNRDQWTAIHMNICLLFLIVGSVHLYLNWSIFWCYLTHKLSGGRRFWREIALALLATLLVVGGTLYAVPPFSSLVDLNDQIKRYWAQRAAPAPMPHAEELRLPAYAQLLELTPDEVLAALRDEGFTVDDPKARLREVAEQNGTSPGQVHAAVLKHFPEAIDRGIGLGKGRGQGRGGGRKAAGGGPGRSADSGTTPSPEELPSPDVEHHPGQEHQPGTGLGRGGQGQGRGQGDGVGRGQGGMGRGLGPGRGAGLNRQQQDDE